MRWYYAIEEKVTPDDRKLTLLIIFPDEFTTVTISTGMIPAAVLP